MTFRKPEEPFQIATTEAAEAGENGDTFENLRRKFSLALRERLRQALPNTVSMKQDGSERCYYILARTLNASSPGRTQEKMRCMRDDFFIFDVTRTVTVLEHLGGAAQIEYCFSKVDPARSELTGTEAGRIVRNVIEGKD